MKRMMQFVARPQPLLTMAFVLVVAVIAGRAESVSAINLNIDTTSPAPQTSVKNDGTTDVTKHLMILSDHGSVPQFKLGLYYDTGGAHTVNVLNAGLNDGGACEMRDVPNYSLAQTYVRVTFARGGNSISYNIDGNDVCNANFWSNTAGIANPRFYGAYTIPASVIGGAADPINNKYFVQMTISFVNSSVISNRQQMFNFKVTANGGLAGNINTGASSEGNPNNSVNGKFEGTSGFIDQYFTFGLSCGAGNRLNAPVTLYDADNYVNARTTARPIKFYVAKVAPNGAMTPLNRNEYQQRADGTLLIDDSGNPNPNTRVDYDGPAGDQYPTFVPGGYDNRGGKTTVYIDKMISAKNDPINYRYVMVVKNIPTNGDGGQNNFIYIGTPGDAIYGAPNFTCPNQTIATVTPSILFDKGIYTGQEKANITANLINADPDVPGTVASAKITVWYDDNRSDSYAGQQIIGVAGFSGTFANPVVPWVLKGATTVDGNKAWICAKIEPIAGAGSEIDPEDDSACSRIVNSPYLRVYGGDVITGTAPTNGDGTCSPDNDDAGVVSWNSGSGAGWAGAGAQFAVQALGTINDFASSQRSSAGAPTGSSFANDPATLINPSAGLFGGKFKSTDGIGCDYTSDIDSATNSQARVANGDTNVRSVMGPVVPLGSPNSTPVLYVKNGDAFIDDNIVTAGGSWLDVSKIPAFRLVVVGGNIYIDHAVTQIFGTYVAEKDSSGRGGTIVTCAKDHVEINPRTSRSTYYNDCNSQLTIYGSFVAQEVHFGRTFGSFPNSTIGERPNLPGANGNANAAEVFVYSPAQWLANLKGIDGGGDLSVTGLPPVL
jgi:hypothetical protein